MNANEQAVGKESETIIETIEQSLARIVAERKCGGIIGLVQYGGFSKRFNMTIERDIDENFLREVFTDIGKLLATDFKLYSERDNKRLQPLIEKGM